ncbi:DNA-processing protein DprA [Roseivirga thermotolerans]|uniref:DNA-processing protein DprA n=1 Tax=Roseivirga thermotolerans TaxID=1758176 RepID=UPI00273D1833|nr:DNA-processing protein DprA [Roseivirga thermotolerans]
MSDDKRYQVALSLIPGIGPVLARQLINHFETPQNIFKATKGRLTKVNGLGQKLADLISGEEQWLKKADRILEHSEKLNINTHYYKEDSYPSRLKSILDAPIVLYTKGNPKLNTARMLGIVGTRKATKYGLAQTERIVENAKSSESVIISGLAYGIDVKSHEAALKYNLATFGVLACGLDTVYPTAHRHIAEKMLDRGGLISEYPVGTKADARLFPARNRIIAGLSDALIVVEAAAKGGALISANIAYSYDKPVFAVPGELGKSYSEGCNLLIRNFKASIYTSFKDIEESLNWDLESATDSKPKARSFDHLPPPQKKVLDILMRNGQQMHIDELSWQSETQLNQLASILLQLEFEGLVKPLPGKEYRLV